MKILLLLISLSISFTIHSQIVERNVSNNTKAFPTRLYLLEDSTFINKQLMGGYHPDDKYFVEGEYLIKVDTLYLLVNRVGFDWDDMTKEPSRKIGLIRGKRIHLLREDGIEYLELKRRSFRN